MIIIAIFLLILCLIFLYNCLKTIKKQIRKANKLPIPVAEYEYKWLLHDVCYDIDNEPP